MPSELAGVHEGYILSSSCHARGQFGETFTVEGLPDDAVCIGDRYQIGSALFEVTEPRVTCYRVGIRMNEPRMPALLTSGGRPGFYLRVLQEDEVGAGDEIVKVGEVIRFELQRGAPQRFPRGSHLQVNV